ncbi:MAG: CoB--CoM heterodisulfide reductase subunit B [Candidatus Bathyarchaeota archaeon]
MSRYAYFLGCLTPNRYPGIEAATVKSLGKFGVELVQLPGASCCPAPGVFGSFDLSTWLALAARNISIAENMNADITLTCNGCYATLQETNHLLKHNKRLAANVNKILSNIGKSFKGSIEVKHVIEILTEEVGLDKIKKEIKHPLKDIKVAVHYGCHFLKPSSVRAHGSAENPTVLDDFVRALGAESVEYKDKAICCGAGGGVRAARLDVALDMTLEKIQNVMEANADCIITPCAFCHFQFDRGQVELSEKLGKKYGLPVLYLTQLLGLALGLSPLELGLDKNETSTETFLKKFENIVGE